MKLLKKMLMRYIVVILFSFLSNGSFSQGYIKYHNLCNKGAELIEGGDFLEAKITLISAINSVNEPIAIDLFNLAKCYSQLNEKDSTLYYLELSLSINYRTKDICSVHNLWFEPILGKEKWDKILKKNYYKEEKLRRWQKRLLVKMAELGTLDQHYIIIQTDSISVYYPEDTVLFNLYSDSVDMNIAIIESELARIIKKRGWPGLKITSQRFTYQSTILIHVSDYWFDKMRLILINEIDKGNLSPWSFTDIADRKQHEHGLPVLYNGYFATQDDVTQEIKDNCEKIGAPLGKIRNIRAYYRM